MSNHSGNDASLAQQDTSEAASEPTDAARRRLLTWATRLEIFTIAWNVVEAGVGLFAAYLAGSLALTGFGFDSLIEIIAAVAVYRRLRAEWSGRGAEEAEKRERDALRVVAAPRRPRAASAPRFAWSA